MKLNLIGKLFLILCSIVILMQALAVPWKYHLRVDIDGQYISHARHFLKNHNLNSLGYNEYQPGAVLFFVALSPVLLINNSNNTYLTAVYAVNLVLIFLIGYLYKILNGYKGVIVFSLILLFMGPIVLYRFDLYTFLFILLAIIFWQKNRPKMSLFLIGIGTIIKIYPALLVPYFLIVSYKNKVGIIEVSRQLLSFFFGLFSVLTMYLFFFGGRLTEIISDLSIHSRKPVHVESVWGSLLTIIPKIMDGNYATGRGDLGIFGLDKTHIIGPIAFYNYCWVVILCLIYTWLLFRIKDNPKLDIRICLFIILSFLVFSKILTAQYLFWFMLFFPLIAIPLKKTGLLSWQINLFLILLVAVLSQFIYPLKYNELLASFYNNGSNSYIFWVLALRNLLIIILALRFYKEIKWNQY